MQSFGIGILFHQKDQHKLELVKVGIQQGNPCPFLARDIAPFCVSVSVVPPVFLL